MKYNIRPEKNQVVLTIVEGDVETAMFMTPRIALQFAKDLKQAAKAAKQLKKNKNLPPAAPIDRRKYDDLWKKPAEDKESPE